MPPPQQYHFDYSIIVCIDDNGTLTIYWASYYPGGDASDRPHLLALEESNWDGNTVETSFTFDDLNGCSPQEVTLTATMAGNAEDGSTIVDVDYESVCPAPDNAPVTGTQTVIVAIGAACPVPVPD